MKTTVDIPEDELRAAIRAHRRQDAAVDAEGQAMSKKEGTVQLEIKLRLPGSVAHEAEARGLLKPESLESMLREEIRRGRIDRLFEAADRLGSIPLSPLTDTEVEAEIQAVRSRQRASHAGGR